ncbi:ribonuclease E/G, partial [Mycobacterium tuberculosis]|nr:ribonuclease E/G [Mycobacterium tuberculosis]
EESTDEELANDVAYLRKIWETIRHNATTLPAPSILYQDLNLAQRVLRDLVTDETRSIHVASRENHQKLIEFAQEYTPA